MPEYIGTLLAFVDQASTAATNEEINAALKEKLPAELEVLDSAAAEDKDTLSDHQGDRRPSSRSPPWRTWPRCPRT